MLALTTMCKIYIFMSKLFRPIIIITLFWSIKTWTYIMHSEGPQLKHHIHNTIEQIHSCP